MKHKLKRFSTKILLILVIILTGFIGVNTVNAYTEEELMIIGTPNLQHTTFSYSIGTPYAQFIESIDLVEVYEIGNPIKLYSGYNTTGTFSNLEAGTDFKITVDFTYDTGSGSTFGYVERIFSTLSYTAPSNFNTSTTVDYDSLYYSITYFDPDNIVEESLIEVYEYNVSQPVLSEYPDTFMQHTLTGLKSDTYYIIEFSYGYDLKDGTGMQYEVYTKTVKTSAYPIPYISNVQTSSTHDSITYEAEIYSPNNFLDVQGVFVYDEDNTLIHETWDTLNDSVGSLLSNHTYKLVISYQYDLNNGNGMQYASKTEYITTLAYQPPNNFNISTSVTHDSLTYTVSYTDPDNLTTGELITVKEVGEVTPIFSEYPDTYMTHTINNLFSNTEYQIEFSYSYDLNDGAGLQTGYYNINVTTLSYTAPHSFSIDTVADYEFVGYGVVFTDPDNMFNLEMVAIYEVGNAMPIYTNTVDLYATAYNLDPNTNYEIEVNYSYDLNDGNGVQYRSVEDVFTTKATEPSNIQFNVIPDYTFFSYNITYDDVTETLTSDLIEVYEVGLSTPIFSDYNPLTNTITGLKSNTQYKITFDYSYNLNDGTGEQFGYVEETFYTLTYPTPTVTLSLGSGDNNIAYDTTIDDPFNLLTTEGVIVLDNLGTEVANSFENDGIITGLQSGTTYTVEFYYSYDLNDGNGSINDKVVETVTTGTLQAPSDITITTSVDYDSISYNITYTDPDNILNEDLIEVFEVGNATAIFSEYPDTYMQHTLTGLKSNTDYQITFDYSYDLNDGNGVQYKTKVVNVSTDRYISPYNFNFNLTIDYEKVDFNITYIDGSNTLSLQLIEVYKVGNTTPVFSAQTLLNDSVTGLQSNTNYRIEFSYAYDLNDGNGEQYNMVSENFTTLSYTDAPSNINIITSVDYTSFTYEITYTDPDNVLNVSLVEVFEVGNITALYSGINTNQAMTGLTSNTDYKITFDYSYDLGDGIQYGYHEKIITTRAYDIPAVTNLQLTSTANSITHTADIYNPIDLNNDLTIEAVMVTEEGGGAPVSTTTTINDTVTGLLSNHLYTVQIQYSYDLNDGSGVQYDYIEASITTKSFTAPTNINIITSVDYTSFTYEITYTDTDNLLNVSLVEVFEVGNTTALYSGINTNQAMTNLYTDTSYRIEFTYTYDLNEGSGLVENTVSKTISTLAYDTPTISNLQLSSTKTSISYNADIYNPIEWGGSINIEGIIVYDEANQEVSSTFSPINDTVTGLLSNHTYTVEINYSYDLNDGNGVQYDYITGTIKTLTFTAPTNINIITSSVDYTSFTYEVTYTDPDNILVIDSIEIFEVGTTNTIYSGTNFNQNITGLLSNTSYRIEFKYSYNLNNGNNDLTGYHDVTLTTLAYDPPSISNIQVTSTKTSISYNADIYDPNGFLTVEAIIVYDEANNEVSSTYTPINDTISNLISNHTYTVKYFYSYDLNDGNGLQATNVSKTIQTLSYTAPHDINIITSITHHTLTYEITYDDPDNLLNIESIKVFEVGNTLPVYEGTNYNQILYDLFSNTDYRIEFKYSYNLNDNEGTRIVTFNKTVRTSAYDIPSVTNLQITSDYRSIDFTADIFDPDGFLKLEGVFVYDEFNTLVYESYTDFNQKIEGLYSNHTYTVKIFYSYDLLDGNGEQFENIEKSQDTKKYDTPTINIELSANDNSIDFAVTQNDEFDLLRLETFEVKNILVTVYLAENVYEIYEQAQLPTNARLTGQVNDLMPNTTYTLYVYYSYDLHDAKGVQEGVESREITTSGETYDPSDLNPSPEIDSRIGDLLAGLGLNTAFGTTLLFFIIIIVGVGLLIKVQASIMVYFIGILTLTIIWSIFGLMPLYMLIMLFIVLAIMFMYVSIGGGE